MLIGAQPATSSEQLIVINPTLLAGDWSNYTVTTTGRISTLTTTVSRDLAIVVRYQDSNNFYWMGLGLYTYKWGIAGKVGGTLTHLSNSLSGIDTAAPLRDQLVLGQTYTLKAVVNGTVLELWVDGVKVCVYDTANDATKLASGSVGFRAYYDQVEFDYIDVQAIAPPQFYNLQLGSYITANPTMPAGGYASGTTVTLTASRTGYTFKNWTGDASGSVNPTTIVMDRNKTVDAVWEQPPVQYTLTLSSSVGGHTSPTGNPTYNQGTVVSVAAIADNGYMFAGWTLDGTNAGTANPISVTMNMNHTLQASFAQPPPLTLTINASLYGTTNPAAGTYQATQNQTIQVSATGISGYIFDHWLLDGADAGKTNPITVTMNASHTLTPVFVQGGGIPWVPLIAGIVAVIGTIYIIR